MDIKQGKLILDDSDRSQARYLYMMIWNNTAISGGVDMWFEVLTRLLDTRGFKIVKKEEE